MAGAPELQLLDLLRTLAEGGVDFVVLGGVAVAVQGYGRATQDLDIAYATNPENLDALGRVLVDLDARLRGVADVVPFVPDGRTLRRGQLLTLDTRLGSLDLLVDPPGAAPYTELRDRADVIALGGFDVRVVALDDLLAMKRAGGRPQDLADIAALEEARRIERDERP